MHQLHLRQPTTIKDHLKKIYQKLDVRNRRETDKKSRLNGNLVSFSQHSQFDSTELVAGHLSLFLDLFLFNVRCWTFNVRGS
jgi:hypothetical protein